MKKDLIVAKKLLESKGYIVRRSYLTENSNIVSGLKVGNSTNVMVKVIGPGYVNLYGEEYYAMGSEDVTGVDSDSLSSPLDLYYVSKDEERVYSVSKNPYSDSEDIVRITRIR